jgi:hypothetical protein
LEAYDKGASSNGGSVKCDADYVGMKPKYVKAAGNVTQGNPTGNSSISEINIVKQLETIQLALDRCQAENRSQREEMRSQRSEMRSLLSSPATRVTGFANQGQGQWTGGLMAQDGEGAAAAAVPGGVAAAAAAGPAYFQSPGNLHTNVRARGTGQTQGGCFVCGLNGHYARDHRNGNIGFNGDVAPKQARGVVAGDVGADVYLRGRLNGQSIMMLLDTGCEQNIIMWKALNT